jgi:hypothetical protein
MMKKTMNRIATGLIMALVLTGFQSCYKQFDNRLPQMTVRMTDAPALYDSVVVYVESVQVNNDSAGGWQTLTTNAGYYDLLLLQGTDTTLVNNGNLQPGFLNQMRLLLAADKNYVVDTNGVKMPLLLSSQDKTGLKLNLNTSVTYGESYELLIDFDANTSILEQGNGKLKLKPMIKQVYLNKL